jgi:hypothetical protein
MPQRVDAERIRLGSRQNFAVRKRRRIGREATVSRLSALQTTARRGFDTMRFVTLE